MKIGIVSDNGHLLGQAVRLSNLNHNVVLQCKDKNIGKGLVSLGQVRPNEYDYTIVNSTRSQFADEWRKAGHSVFGGGKLDEALTKEPFTKLLLNAAGLNTEGDVKGFRLHTGGFFNGEEFTFMFSFLPADTYMDGGRGRKADMGCIFWPHFFPNNLLREALFALKPTLAKFNFHGMVTLGVNLSEFDLEIFEVSSLTRPDVLDCFFESIRMDPGRALYHIAKGDSNRLNTRNDYAVCVNVTAPPFPEAPTQERDISFSFPTEAARHIYLKDVHYDDGYIGGKTGFLLSVTAWGQFVREARKRAYRTISNLSIPEMAYRTDIGELAPKQLHLLDEWGWI